MIYCWADNILSPLGFTTAENYRAVKSGRSSLQRYDHRWPGVPPFTASLFTEEQRRQLAVEGLTRFESLAVRSIRNALEATTVDVADRRVVLILCTTKANIELMEDGTVTPQDDAVTPQDDALSPSVAAGRIARAIGVSTEPVVVCNACISGVAGIVLALRLLDAHQYDTAIVCGADVQSLFTISGFQSLQALSCDDCRPFDIERTGLNLGEAAGTIIFGNRPLPTSAGTVIFGNQSLPTSAGASRTIESAGSSWTVERGAVRNDAFHISSPSKNGEGALQALLSVVGDADADSLAFINAHGTATMYNDQMESVAIDRAGLGAVPVNALKGYLGHTMGAAGIVETILSMKAVDDNTILATRGFEELGVSGHVNVVAAPAVTHKTSFVKMISGFGGCNAAIRLAKQPVSGLEQTDLPIAGQAPASMDFQTSASIGCQVPVPLHTVRITPDGAWLDGSLLSCDGTDGGLVTSLYRQYIGDYPRYYKMDALSRLGFVAAELLLRAAYGNGQRDCGDCAMVLFNHTSSIVADRAYWASVRDEEKRFPSPSAFVYTLPNMVTGEAAIRFGSHGETSLYQLYRRNDLLMRQILAATATDRDAMHIVSGWIDCQDERHFIADLTIAKNPNK